MNKSQLKRIIKEELQAVLKEGFVSATGDTPEMIAAVVRRWMADENIDSNDQQTIEEKITDVAVKSGVRDDDIPDWQDAVFEILGGAVNEENGSAGMSFADARSSVYTQYSPMKFLEVLDTLDKQITDLISGNPFTYSGATLPLNGMRGTINDIRKAAELEMKNEDL